MLNKLKKIISRKPNTAEQYEKKGQWQDAYKEYLRVGNYYKAGEILEKTGRWVEAANIYIKNNDIDKARRAIDNCFKSGRAWEIFRVDPDTTISIEEWLKAKGQTRRFVRYVQNVETVTPKGIPLIIVLADKLKNVAEYKSAAELYKKGFHLVNKGKTTKEIKNEIWLRHATECYAKSKLYDFAAECMKTLMMTEVQIGSDISKDYRYNPYRNYTYNLQMAKELNFLKELVEKLEDFDPFNIAYDLIKIGKIGLSEELFFKYFGRIAKKHLTEEETEIRNEKVSYCLNQYVIFYRDKKQYKKAAEIALLNSQKKIAAELYKMAGRVSEGKKASLFSKKDRIETIFKCPTCGEEVKPNWEMCPNCENVLTVNVCECGEPIKPHWKRCPTCHRKLG